MNFNLQERLNLIRDRLAGELLEEVNSGGHWVGELSGSALSTATALIALATVNAPAHAEQIGRGLNWLANHANDDGGWGDTIRSRSNLSTTALVWAAFGATQSDAHYSVAVRGAESYLCRLAGSLDQLVPAIEAIYGKDRTFSVPITMALALSGRLGAEGWRQVRPLPFELAALPRGLFGALRLPVVSYALPALIAIGQVIHHHVPRWNPIRNAARRRTLKVLSTLQPSNGGFLEATPLTSFVTMSLGGMGLATHSVAQRGVSFLRVSARPDGSWPIDTNLATWVTTLAIKAFAYSPGQLSLDRKQQLRAWILKQQYVDIHPYTGAAPGGWAWTDLPGGVPDADDTSGALLALRELLPTREEDRDATLRAVVAGITWLLGVQNRDGGVPTFCRGWGALPFDRSTPEITAHALRAWAAWMPELRAELRQRVNSAARRAMHYLVKAQNPDGSWTPLWFGNESTPEKSNPVYGTAQILIALAEIRLRTPRWDFPEARRIESLRWLLSVQNSEGGWGGAGQIEPTVEETSLALSALSTEVTLEAQSASSRGAVWLMEHLPERRTWAPAPIGLYFAQLWYFERLYPRIFALEALGRLVVGPATSQPN